jgi:hypothetical protein
MMLLLSMEGSFKITLPRSGFVQQAVQAGQITVGWFRSASHFSQLQFAP